MTKTSYQKLLRAIGDLRREQKISLKLAPQTVI
jgi:hypothetical protein